MESAILTPKRTEYGKSIRKSYENGEIKESRRNMNRLEPRTDGISNTLTTVQKDNLLIEVKQIGNMDAYRENFENQQCGRVYDCSGLSPTINTCQGGQREPKIIVQTKPLGNLNGHKLGSGYAGSVYDTNGLSPTINTMGGGNREPMIVAMRGRNPDNPPDRTAGSPTEQRLEPNSQGICNTLTSVQKDNMVLENPVTTQGNEVVGTIRACTYKCGLANVEINCEKGSGFGYEGVVEPTCRIRKLTPIECWRLMGFSDEDFHRAEEVNSNSQLYKQAGNSIVKNVLIAIFGQMMSGKENLYKEL